MISFWRYDQSGDTEDVRTDFFDIPTQPDGETFCGRNSSETLPLCGKMKEMQQILDMELDKQSMAMPVRIPE